MKNLKFTISDKKGNYTTINIKEIGKLKAFDNKIKVYSFLIECETKEENIYFIFHNSIDFTQKRDNLKRNLKRGMNKKDCKELIYNVLACIGMDYYADCENMEDFISAYGYEYNKETNILFHKVKEQKQKLNKVFTDEQIKMFDENDDILKKYVEGLVFERDIKKTI